ncbi:MAG TPA: PAS domain-containing protein, partial [Planctomycetaceae bacterium]|nr:PAS domain-containing protein [Planctomycetaceae bacterium]
MATGTVTPKSATNGKRSFPLEAVVTAAAAPMFVTDKNLVIRHISDAALGLFGYSRSEVVGKMTCADLCRTRLCRTNNCTINNCMRTGKPLTGRTVCQTRDGREMSVNAYCNALFDGQGAPIGGIEVLIDWTEAVDHAGQVSSINDAQAVIHFNMDGTIITANDNFLNAFGYTLPEVQGQHHSMLVEPDYKNSPEYRRFWEALNRGEAQVGEFKRIGKGGKEVWVQASYTPIKDLNGKPFKVVKYATDVTEQKLAQRGAMAEINRLIDSAKNGRLADRADVEKARGDFKRLFQGMNEMLDAFIAPLNVTAEYVARISKGDIPEKITDEYKGDFTEIKDNLNVLIDALNGLIEAVVTMAKATEEGQLDTRVDTSEFQGIWQRIVQTLNDTAEGVVVPLRDVGSVLDAMARKDFTRAVEKDYSGDYQELKRRTNVLGKNIRDAMAQINESANQFTEGARVIAESSQTLAQGAQEQSASVEEVTASVEELSRSIKGVKENAHVADKMAKEAKELAEQGRVAVGKSIEAMNLIRTSSDQIAEIIQVIS